MLLTCEQTGKTIEVKENADGTAKLSHGWKRVYGKTLSPDAVKLLYVRRVIYLPILKPIAAEGSDSIPTWDDFGRACRDSFKEAAIIANLAMRQMAVSDAVIGPGKSGEKTKLPKFDPPKTLYDLARSICPGHPTSSVVDLLQRLNGIYRSARFEMLVTVRKSLPSFRSGSLPLNLKSKTWTPSIDKDGNIFMSFRLGSREADGLRCQRITVQLKRGNNQRHADLYEKICRGEIEAADAKIKDSAQGLGVCVTCLLPRGEKASGENSLIVSTRADSFLVWCVAGQEDRPPLHMEQIKNLLFSRDAENRKWSDDMKWEKRWPSHVRQRMNHRHEKKARAYKYRLNNFIESISKLTMGFAKRRGCGTIIFNDKDHGFAEKFPWYVLKQSLKSKCEMDGLIFVEAPAEPKGDQGQSVSR